MKKTKGIKQVNKPRTAKFPRPLGELSISTKRTIKNTQLMDERHQILNKKTKELNKGAFEVAGAYPMIFDTLCYACTHYPEGIDRKNISKETHYKAALPINVFYDFALDGHKEHSKRLLNELLLMNNNPIVKCLPFNDIYSIKTTPIRLDLVYADGSKETKNLKNIHTGEPILKEIKFINIEFYKPLFQTLLNGKHEEGWFLIPKAFHAKMLTAIDECKELPEFKKYENFGYSINYRKAFFYINLHDNKKSDFLNINLPSFMKHCLPSNYEEKNGKGKSKSWWAGRLFFMKTFELINYMSRKGYMEDIPTIPINTFYDQKSTNLKVTFHRKIKKPEKAKFLGQPTPKLEDTSNFNQLPYTMKNPKNSQIMTG